MEAKIEFPRRTGSCLLPAAKYNRKTPAEPPCSHRRSIGKVIVEGRMLFIPLIQSDFSREKPGVSVSVRLSATLEPVASGSISLAGTLARAKETTPWLGISVPPLFLRHGSFSHQGGRNVNCSDVQLSHFHPKLESCGANYGAHIKSLAIRSRSRRPSAGPLGMASAPLLAYLRLLGYCGRNLVKELAYWSSEDC